MRTLCDPADCTLLVIDPQVRLMPAIHDAENVIRRCVQLATDLDARALDLISIDVPLEDAIAKAEALMSGQVRGRIVVSISGSAGRAS